jgi:glutamine synthetase
MTLDELRRAAADGTLDAVMLALADIEGRLQGKRFTAHRFLEEIVPHGAEACEYLLASDVDMSPVEGYGFAGWECGFGDFGMRPDLDSLRLLPWAPGAALLMADAVDHHGARVHRQRVRLRPPAPAARAARRARSVRLQ